MDTPDKSQAAGTPLSTVEDSPVFNFINNLSPIKPVKSVHTVQAYTSPGFSSVWSVFSSPHINLQKESRLLIRQSYSELSKQGNPSENRDESNFCTVVSDGIKLSTSIMVARENCNLKCSLNEATVDPPDECLTLPSNLLQSVQYDCSSPDHNITPCYGTKLDLKLDIGCSEVELGQHVQDGLDKRKRFFTTEIIQEKHLVDQTKEVPGSDWENLISNEVDDLLIFGESAELGDCDSQDEKLVDKDAVSLTTLSSNFMEEAVDDLQKTQPDASFGPCVENTTQDPPVIHSGEIGEQDETDDNPSIIAGTFQNHAGISNQSWEASNGGNDCVPFDYKVDSQQQRGIRRRCLVFEVSGGSKRGSHNDSNIYSSDSLPSKEKSASDNRSLTSLKAGASPSPCVLPGIGLHLNTLASTSKDRMVTQETLPSGRRLISMPCSIGPFPTRTARQKSLNMSLDVEIDMGPTGNEAQNIQILQDDASQAPELGSGEDLSQSSPKKKRRKPDSSGESEACKRCNCKKSKCLKLYCECFAAGVYCIEPCSCQGCYNKPIHEETVLETRKQIESRNPLAFAPKVIRTSETVHDMGEEANKTPASARHKRGCNCKKSSCLKKYCECYQGGVGCSISCRCEGCKNAFGRKDGVVSGTEEIEIGEEEIIACEEDKPDDGLANVDVQKEQSSESILLTTPLQICRTSVKLPFLSSGKPPRSSTLPIEYSPLLNTCQRKSEIQLPQRKFGKHVITVPEDDTPEILRGNASPSNCVKTASPNSKRVSPPHNGFGLSPSCKGGRKLILKSIPSFPSLNSDVINECPGNQSNNSFNSSSS